MSRQNRTGSKPLYVRTWRRPSFPVTPAVFRDVLTELLHRASLGPSPPLSAFVLRCFCPTMNGVVFRCAIIPCLVWVFFFPTMNISGRVCASPIYSRFSLRIPRAVSLCTDTGVCGDTSVRGGPRAPHDGRIPWGSTRRGSEPSMYPGTTNCGSAKIMCRGHHIHVSSFCIPVVFLPHPLVSTLMFIYIYIYTLQEVDLGRPDGVGR